MIIAELRGRIGNAMFIIALGKYLSDKVGTELAVIKSKEFSFGHYYDNEIFPYEFFKDIKILDDDYDTSSFKKITNPSQYYNLIDFPIEDNLLLSGWFLSGYYVDYNTIKDLYKPSKELKEEIFDLYNPTRNSLMLNIRRGDFLWRHYLNQGYHSEPKEYWEFVYNKLNKKYDKVFVTSDDTLWCHNLDFCDNLVIVDKPTSNKIFLDLFIGTFVGDNAISCSTFSWWTAYLNRNPNKIVIKPYPWNVKNGDDNVWYYDDTDIKIDIHTLSEV